MNGDILRQSKYGISGAHGTGKSTLINLITQSSFENVNITPEAPRIIINAVNDEKYFQRGNNSLSRQLLIFPQHLIQEMTVKEEIIITDRTLIDHLAYTQALHSENEEFNDFKSVLISIVDSHLRTFEKLFFIPIEFKVKSDGVREDDIKFQKEINDIMLELYSSLGYELIELRGSPQERLEILKSEIGV